MGERYWFERARDAGSCCPAFAAWMERGRAIGSRGHATIAELCRKEGIAQSLYYSWSKEFLGKAHAAIGSRPRRTARIGRPVTQPGKRTLAK